MAKSKRQPTWPAERHHRAEMRSVVRFRSQILLRIYLAFLKYLCLLLTGLLCRICCFNSFSCCISSIFNENMKIQHNNKDELLPFWNQLYQLVKFSPSFIA